MAPGLAMEGMARGNTATSRPGSVLYRGLVLEYHLQAEKKENDASGNLERGQVDSQKTP